MLCHRTLSRLYVCGLTIVLFIAAVVPSYAKSYDHPSIEITYRFDRSGNAEVEEIREFRFDGSFSWAQILRETSGAYGRYGLEYHEVRDLDTDRKMPMTTSRENGQEKLRWSYSAQDETKRFLIRYTIRNAIQRYADAAQFYWKAIEDDHAPVGRVKITLIPPAASPVLFKVFVHSQARPGELVIADDFTNAVVTQRDISSGFVEVRALFDPDLFPGMRIRNGESHASLLDDEKKITNATRRAAMLQWVAILGGLIIVGALVVFYLRLYRKYGREPELLNPSVYEHEPPRELPPAVVPAILTQSSASTTNMTKGFAATLLEAARLGYLTVAEIEGEGALGLGIFKNDTLQYTLTDTGKMLLAAGRIEKKDDGGRKRRRRLEDFEIRVLQIVFEQAGDGTRVTNEEIKVWAKKTSGRKTRYLIFIEKWAPQCRDWFESEYFTLDDPTSEKKRKMFMGITGGLGLLLLVAVPLGVHWWAAIIGAVLLFASAPLGHILARRTPEAALEHHRWEAFKDFINDYSAFKDAGPELLPLWEKYLVYATALGVADKLLDNLKLVAKEYNSYIPAAPWYHSTSSRAGAAGVGSMNFESLNSLSKSLQNLNNLSQALSTKSSSGGGFSGGGGGGGGGGSSGAG